jgi:hypothetical protein
MESDKLKTKPNDTENESTISLNKEQILLIEKYYLSFKKQAKVSICDLYINDILEKYPENKYIIFFLYWIPLALSNEVKALQLLNRVKEVYVDNEVITLINYHNVARAAMNKYAFNLAVKFGFDNNVTVLVLKQGRIVIPMEWLYERLKANCLDLAEAALDGGNECQLTSKELKHKYLPYIKCYLDSAGATFSLSKTPGKRLQKKYSFSAFGTRTKTKKKTVKVKNDFRYLAEGEICKLTINKIIILADIICEENIKTNEKDLIRAVCLFDREKKSSPDVLEGLYLSKNKKITLELLQAGLLVVNLSVFQKAMYQKDMKFVLQFYEIYKEDKLFNNEDFHNDLVYLIQEDIQNIEIYLFFIRKFILSFSINSIKILLKIIEVSLDISCEDLEILKIISNPIKIYVLMAEVLKLCKKRYPVLDHNISRLIAKALDYSLKIQNLIEEDIIVREILLEKDLDGRLLIDVISTNGFVVLLKNKLVEKICDDLLLGPYSLQGSPLEASSQYQILNTSVSYNDYNVFTKMRNTLSTYNPLKYKCNITHFKVWRKSVNDKFYVHLLFAIIMVILYQALCLYLLYIYQSLMSIDAKEIFNNSVADFLKSADGVYYFNNHSFSTTTGSDVINNINSIRDKYTDFLSKINFLKAFCTYVPIIYYFYLLAPVDHLYRVLFWIKSSKPSFGLALWADLVLFFLAIMLLVDNYALYHSQYVTISTQLEFRLHNLEYLKTYTTDLLMFRPEDNPLQITFIKFAVFCIFLWLKLILMVRGTKTFGSVIVIYFLAIKGIITYIIIFLISVIGFSAIGSMILYTTDTGKTYKNMFYTFMKYFFISTSESPDFVPYSTDYLEIAYPYLPYLSGVFFGIIMVVNTIVMVNLIIAVLTNIYDRNYNNAIQMLIQKRFEIKKKFSCDDERYDSLLVNVYPFNLFSFPLAMCFLCVKTPTTINKFNLVILRFNFWVFGVIYILLFSLVTLLLVPFTYIKITFCKFVQIFVKDIQNYLVIYKVFNFLLYIVCGILLQLAIWFMDIIIFCIELEKQNIPLATENENIGRYSLNQLVLKLIRKLRCQFDGEIKIPIDRFIRIVDKLLNEEDNAQTTIEDMLYSYSIDNKRKGSEKDTSFSIFNNDLIKRYESKGINYLAFIDFLDNFVDEKDIINLNLLIDMLDINYVGAKIREYYKGIAEGNQINLSQKQFQFLYRVETYMKNEQCTITKLDTCTTTEGRTQLLTNGIERERTAQPRPNTGGSNILTKYLNRKRSKVSATSDNIEMEKIESSPLNKPKKDTLFIKDDKINFIAFKSLLLHCVNKKNKQQSPSLIIKLPVVPISVLDKFMSGVTETEISKKILETITENDESRSKQEFIEAKFKAMEDRISGLEEINKKLLRLTESLVYGKGVKNMRMENIELHSKSYLNEGSDSSFDKI